LYLYFSSKKHHFIWQHGCTRNYNFEIQPGPAGYPGMEPGRVEEKIKEKKLDVTWQVDWRPGWPGNTRLKIWLQPIDFKKKNWPERSGQNPEPELWTGPGLKTMPAALALIYKVFSLRRLTVLGCVLLGLKSEDSIVKRRIKYRVCLVDIKMCVCV
jgi:hypothetical protein